MRKDSANSSKPDSGAQAVDSVIDFLYADTPRIASFLSQFTRFGHLTSIVNGRDTARQSENRGTVKAGIQFPYVANADGEFQTSRSFEEGEKTERAYDPKWTNALQLLKHLAENNLLNRDITSAAIGEFVIHTGPIKIHDLQFLERMWRLKSIGQLMRAGASKEDNRESRRRAAAQGKASAPADVDLMLDMLGVLPHSIQAKLGDIPPVWCNLVSEGLSTTSSDLVLKHGAKIPGVWSIVGILDARPESEPTVDAEPDFSEFREIGTKLLDVIMPITRAMLGRDSYSFGMTPILIFRNIGKGKNI